jgi:hypothetical protein
MVLRSRAAWGALAAVLVQLVVAITGFGPALPEEREAAPLRPSAAAGLYFDHLVVILMENKDLCDVLTYCGGFSPYLTRLADASGLADEERYCHMNPSLPNYLCLTGGSDFGCEGYSGNPNSNACTGAAWNAPNIVDRLEAGGLTWKAYMEDMPSDCYALDSGDYAVRHNPFVYYKDIATNATRCARVVPSGNAGSVLLNDLNSPAAASNYMWFTPNNCNSMHSCREEIGDTYMSVLVPKILNSTMFQTTRAALLVTFDEAYGFPAYTVWAGPVAKPAYVSSYPYDHYSVLATIESNWNLTPLTSNDGGASHMGEFFIGQPSRGFHTPPPHPIPIAYLIGISGAGGVAVILTGVFLFRRERRLRDADKSRL